MPNPSTRRILWFLFGAALLLRLYGLSHDLHFDVVYHPDTPKQVRATEQFLAGDYLVFQGHSDYDGYPFFNSHLVEYLARVVMAVKSGWLHLVGAWTGPVEPPSYHTLFWMTRIWNAFLSALAVPLIFAIGRRFNRAVAYAAALLLLVSPLDICTAHFAANDTAVAFFCLLALWFSFRVAEAGRWRDLAGGAFAVAAAFSSKYHGAMSVVPLFIALIAQGRTCGGVLSRPMIVRWLFTGVTGFVSVLLTSPALLVNFDASVASILHFFLHTANFALSEEAVALAPHERFWLGFSNNLPVLADAVGWPVLLSSAVAAGWVFRDHRVALILSLPLIHILLGIAGKPHLHAAHHLPATAGLFIAAAVLWFGDLARWMSGRFARVLVACAALWSAGQLSVFTYHELAAFRLTDTRRVAHSWVLDSVPTGVQWLTGSYTITPPPHQGPPLPVHAFAQSGDRPHVLDGFVEWARFSHAEARFSGFINRPVFIHTVPSHLFRLPVSAPYLMPFPGGQGESAVFLPAPWLGRSARVRDVTPALPLRVTAVDTQALAKAWIVVQTATEPVSLSVGFGGWCTAMHLRAGEQRVFEVPAPASCRIPFDRHYYYRWSADATWGAARVMLMTDADELARWALENGEKKWAVEAARQTDTQSLPVALVKALFDPEAEATVPEVRDLVQRVLSDPNAWMEAFGMTEEWMSALPYLTESHRSWRFHRDPATGETGWMLAGLHLNPGIYRMQCELAQPAGFAFKVTDHYSRTLQEGQSEDGQSLSFMAEWPGNPVNIILRGLPGPPRSYTIRPDARAMLTRWLDQLGQAIPRSEVPPSLRVEPLARFTGGLELLSADVDTAQAVPGGKLEVSFTLAAGDGVLRPDRYSLWLHVVNAQRKVVVQFDNDVWHYLRAAIPDGRMDPPRDLIALPTVLPPGSYEIRVGLWIPDQRKRMKVSDSRIESTERYAVIGRFDVVEGGR